jgi:hypothetical protein
MASEPKSDTHRGRTHRHAPTCPIHPQSVGHLLPPETKCKADSRRFPVSEVDLETFEGQLLGGRSMASPLNAIRAAPSKLRAMES